MSAPNLPERPLRVLSVSTMFPSSALPLHAVFVRYRLLALARLCDVRVLCPVPDFPLVARVFEKYRSRLGVPESQLHESKGSRLIVDYPRFLSVPGTAKPIEGLTLALTLGSELSRLADEGFVPDVIDAHLAYPDGFAAVLAARKAGLPSTITLRGHDINDLHRFPVRWRQVKFALGQASGIFGVCRALVDGAIAAGAPPERTAVLSNGVDPEVFVPMDREAARVALGLPRRGRLVVSVGHLVARKGFHHLVDALAVLRSSAHNDVRLALVGAPGEEGDATALIKARVVAHGLEDKVIFVGGVANEALFRWYSAADAFALASEKEGWPNVLFEALACGTPCVATRVWGTPECLSSPDYGVLVDGSTPAALAQGLSNALSRSWDREQLRAYARANTWADVGRRFHVELNRAVWRHRGLSEATLLDRFGPRPLGPNASRANGEAP